MNQRRSIRIALVTLSLLVAACGSDAAPERAATTSTTTTSSTVPAPTPSTEPAPTPPDVDWSDCGGGECATVVVPLDHDDPEGETISLFVKRLPATGDRIGGLFFNFGGPGAGAADLITQFPIPDSIRQRFDIIGMDPRGVGQSTPLDCGLDPATLYSADPTIEDETDAAALIDISTRYANDCEAAKGAMLPHLGTKNVARDMDLIRAGMGDDRLSYVGYSYGTSIGQAYAELFPDRVRAMIIDGLVDPEPAGIDSAIDQAKGFETALANWAAACPSRSNCRLDDPLDVVDEVLALAEEGVESSNGARVLGPGEAAIALAYPLYNQTLWPSLDRALADALAGDGAGMVALADSYAGLADFSIYFAVSCLDSAWPDSTDVFLSRAAAAEADAPRFGEAIVNDYIRCAVWPVEPDPVGGVTADGAPPILVVSTTGDPATPYENGVTVAERLTSGVLLTYEGEGHTITFQGSSCVDTIAVDYLVDLEPPAHDSRC
ncbi:alpha/beta hydrolase [Actinospongicola halichondriae]|uniref:alpha/beta hydrolase n=1 Tax=Actinospongicola halichondriae TaxID=3236844 RepID=UPI003D4BD9D3